LPNIHGPFVTPGVNVEDGRSARPVEHELRLGASSGEVVLGG
jgi:hypothetical protein